MEELIRRTERGWGAHFCCANRCLFRRNTLLEYKDKKIVISTVGKMQLPNEEIDTIGDNRFYETKCFESDCNDTQYNDIDIEKEIFFMSNWCIDHPYADDEANKMHEDVVSEMYERIKEETL